VSVTVRVAPAGTVSVVLKGIDACGPVIAPANVVVWSVAALLRRSALTVTSELLRSAALSSTTWALRTEIAPSCESSGANCGPVQLSGDFGFQSTMSRVR
jgi:hypothetical protein